MKKVQVQMSNTCHAVLKDYANAWDMTMSEVMYEAIRSYIHEDSEFFEHIHSLLAFRGIPIVNVLANNVMAIYTLLVNTEPHAEQAYTRGTGK